MLPLLLAILLAAPERLTEGAGNHTEAAWSPDGSRIVFQTDAGGDADLAVLDLASGRIALLVDGPGHACFPCWADNGRVVYSFALLERTAASGLEHGYNLFEVGLGGERRRLTSGLERDYTPSVSPGGLLLFATTRGGRDSVGISRLSSDGSEVVVPPGPPETAAVQPVVSADGRFLAYGYVPAVRANWAIQVARLAKPERSLPLTDSSEAFYGPRWAPSGTRLACTGYVPGDPGWGIYVIEATTGARRRVETGPGNSRSPSWSPDGKWLVYENNQSGSYQLYRVAAPDQPADPVETAAGSGDCELVADYRLGAVTDGGVADQSGRGNHLVAIGGPEPAQRGLRFPAGSALTAASPKGLDFGRGPFAVAATVRLDQALPGLQHIAVGQDPSHALAWQLYLDGGRARFNSREAGGEYRGAASDRALPLGREIRLLGLRTAVGGVRLYVDGILQAASATGADFSHAAPVQLRVGSQYNGANPFGGALLELAVYRGNPAVAGLRRAALAALLGP